MKRPDLSKALSHIVSSDLTRQNLSAPWAWRGRVAATNGHILVAVGSTLEPDLMTLPLPHLKPIPGIAFGVPDIGQIIDPLLSTTEYQSLDLPAVSDLQVLGKIKDNNWMLSLPDLVVHMGRSKYGRVGDGFQDGMVSCNPVYFIQVLNALWAATGQEYFTVRWTDSINPIWFVPTPKASKVSRNLASGMALVNDETPVVEALEQLPDIGVVMPMRR